MGDRVEEEGGERKTVFYRAANNGDEAVVGRATYNVTPDAAGYDFSKTECFCFSEQKLAPGETAEMPIVFFLDPEMTEDIDTKSIKAITLSYTFFKQDSDEAAVAAASSLKEQGETRQRELSQAETAEFTNHVLRPR